MGLAMNPEASAKTAPGNRAPETPDLASILAKPASPLGVKLHCFGDYELLEEIAHGGMGDTNSWRAVYVHTNTASPIVWAAPATNGLQFYRALKLP